MPDGTSLDVRLEVTDPDGARWEWYVKTGDAETMALSVTGEGGTCCA